MEKIVIGLLILVVISMIIYVQYKANTNIEQFYEENDENNLVEIKSIGDPNEMNINYTKPVMIYPCSNKQKSDSNDVQIIGEIKFTDAEVEYFKRIDNEKYLIPDNKYNIKFENNAPTSVEKKFFRFYENPQTDCGGFTAGQPYKLFLNLNPSVYKIDKDPPICFLTGCDKKDKNLEKCDKSLGKGKYIMRAQENKSKEKWLELWKYYGCNNIDFIEEKKNSSFKCDTKNKKVRTMCQTNKKKKVTHEDGEVQILSEGDLSENPVIIYPCTSNVPEVKNFVVKKIGTIKFSFDDVNSLKDMGELYLKPGNTYNINFTYENLDEEAITKKYFRFYQKITCLKPIAYELFNKEPPTEPSPTEPSPTDPSPTEPSPTDPSPTEPSPTEPSPTDPSPTDPSTTTSPVKKNIVWECYKTECSKSINKAKNKKEGSQEALNNICKSYENGAYPNAIPGGASGDKTKLINKWNTYCANSYKNMSSCSDDHKRAICYKELHENNKPSPTEPSPTEPSPTEPSPTEPSPTEPSTTRPSPTEPSTTRPSTTRPSTTRPSTTRPSTTRPSTTRPSTTRPSTTRPSTTRPSTTRPSTTRRQGKQKLLSDLIFDHMDTDSTL